MLLRISTTGSTSSRNPSYLSGQRASPLPARPRTCKKPSLRTSCGEGFLRPAECAGRGLALCPAGSALPHQAIINLDKDGARPFGRAICIFSRTIPAVRYVGVGATCIFGSILQPQVLAYRLSAKNRCSAMLSANNWRCYGPPGFKLQGYLRSYSFVVALGAFKFAEYSQKCTAP